MGEDVQRVGRRFAASPIRPAKTAHTVVAYHITNKHLILSLAALGLVIGCLLSWHFHMSRAAYELCQMPLSAVHMSKIRSFDELSMQAELLDYDMARVRACES